MPVKRVGMSISQFCDLLGIEPISKLTGLEMDRRSSRVTLVLEPDEDVPPPVVKK